MRIRIVPSLTILLASTLAMADEKKSESSVRVLDINVEGEIAARFGPPAVIVNADQLAKAIKDEAAVAAIKKAVDFDKEQVLYFAWSGSGQDKLTFTANSDKKGPDVVFTFTAGRTRDIKIHKKLFALPKDAKFKVVGP